MHQVSMVTVNHWLLSMNEEPNTRNMITDILRTGLEEEGGLCFSGTNVLPNTMVK